MGASGVISAVPPTHSMINNCSGPAKKRPISTEVRCKSVGSVWLLLVSYPQHRPVQARVCGDGCPPVLQLGSRSLYSENASSITKLLYFRDAILT